LHTHKLQRIKRENWPPLIKDIAAVIGDDAALKLFIRFAGRHLRIPKTSSHDQAIESTIGEEKAKRLFKIYAGEVIVFPNAFLILMKERNSQIAKEWDRGMKQCDIATKHQLTERRINEIIRKHKMKHKDNPARKAQFRQAIRAEQEKIERL
jgi:Mor family transcriptional regulator